MLNSFAIIIISIIIIIAARSGTLDCFTPRLRDPDCTSAICRSQNIEVVQKD